MNYLFDSDNKDEKDNLSSFGAVVLLKFDTLHSLEAFIESVYYNTYSMTLHYQVQFIIKVHCRPSVKNAIECALKQEQWLARWKRDLDVKKENIMKFQKKKDKQLSRDIMIKKNRKKQYKKQKYLENPASRRIYQKTKC